MTVLIGVVHKSHVYLGADTAETWGNQQYAVPAKLWQHGGFVFGATGCTREGQIVQHRLVLPERPKGVDLMRWLVNDFVDAVRAARREAGYDEKLTTGVEQGPLLLFGVGGRLFTLSSSYAITEHTEYALGSGAAVALGSLHTSAQLGASIKKRMVLALQAACAHDIYCAPPFTFADTKGR